MQYSQLINYFIRHTQLLNDFLARLLPLLTAVCFIPLVLWFQWVYFRLLLWQNLLELVLNGFRQFVYLSSLQRLLKKCRHLSSSLQALALAALTSYVSDRNSSRKAARTCRRVIQSGLFNCAACVWCDDVLRTRIGSTENSSAVLMIRYVYRLCFAET